MADITSGPTVDRVHELLDYDPDTGTFRWRPRPSMPNQMKAQFAGLEAGSMNLKGYRTIRIDGRMHNAQRLAWLYVTGEWAGIEIDHINRVKGDNRFSNLRPATKAQNAQNRKTPSTNTSGVRGVNFCLQTKSWRVQITVRRRRIYLGRHRSLEKAAAVYAEAARKYHGEFSNL